MECEASDSSSVRGTSPRYPTLVTPATQCQSLGFAYGQGGSAPHARLPDWLHLAAREKGPLVKKMIVDTMDAISEAVADGSSVSDVMMVEWIPTCPVRYVQCLVLRRLNVLYPPLVAHDAHACLPERTLRGEAAVCLSRAG